VTYEDFPTVEWTVYLKNTGPTASPFIDHLNALDIRTTHVDGQRFVLHHNAGSFPGRASYAPYETVLPRGSTKRLAAYGGRPTNTDMSYFNLDQGGQGFIIAMGWPGQWAMQFMRDDSDGLHIRGGQELTHLRLHPGEEIRTPLVALQFWKGDWIDAQNVWRRWMVEHNLPRPGGKPLAPMLSAQAGYALAWMYQATEENQKQFIDRFLELGIDIDHWWMDTGWYYTQGVPDVELTDDFKKRKEQGSLWEVFNTWEFNHGRFPRGIRAVSDHAHAKGIKTILWFEPERVTPGSWQQKARPEWCLRASSTDQQLLNLGHPAALRWAVDRIGQVLTEQGIDVYRSDFNMDPLDHWRQNDAPDRQGITENHWVRGYLAFWDALLQDHPDLLIDSCASGGRRNDLETMRRGVPLWKCDYAVEAVGMQCHTFGLAMWIPYFGNAGGQLDPYVFRSNMYPAVTKGAWEDRSPGHDVRKDQDYSGLRRMIKEWRQVAPNYLGDYYPLSPYTSDKTNVWMAWQFQRPEVGEGVVHAFRRPGNESEPTQWFKLRGLDPKKQYELTNFDLPETWHMNGESLMQKGVKVVLDKAPGAALIAYKRMD